MPWADLPLNASDQAPTRDRYSRSWVPCEASRPDKIHAALNTDQYPSELRLLLACAKIHTSEQDDAAIRNILDGGVDWTQFAQKTLQHSLTSLAGHTLARVAPDSVPHDILNAFRVVVEQTRIESRALFRELTGLIETLADLGIQAIPLKGPVLAIQAYGDLGLRKSRRLHFLIRESNTTTVMAALLDLGYERTELSGPHYRATRLPGLGTLQRKGAKVDIEPITRVTPFEMALDFDHAGLWQRALKANLDGRTMLTLAPEDTILVLALHGSRELWWNLKWACDFAAFVGSQPELDWTATIVRARTQGCLRMLLLATSLARKLFHTTIPDEIDAAGKSDSFIQPMVSRILAGWQADEPTRPPGENLLMDRLWLHDRTALRTRYVLRTILAPRPRGRLRSHLKWDALVRMFAISRWRDALAGSRLPIALLPASNEAKVNIRRHRRARAEAMRVVTADPSNLSGWRVLGDSLSNLKRYGRAIACYDQALIIEPDNSGIWKKRRAALKAVGKHTGLPEFARSPQDANTWAIRAGFLSESQRFVASAAASDRAVTLDPDHVAARRIGIQARLHSCNWGRREDDKRRITQGLRFGQRLIEPLFHRAMCTSEEESLRLAQLCANRGPRLVKSLWTGERYHHDKIRIAYISRDFRTHPVGSLIACCLEHHDKSRFEITAVSLHPSDGSEVRRRIEAAVDRFNHAEATSDRQVATTLRELEIDIAVDLNGNSGAKRTGILARRPAPIQVNYLGYPGTMGVPFIDYIIADHTLIPDENQIHYSEKVAYLPHTYMPTDRTRQISEVTPTRAEAGLPETGFIFTCHNAAYKFSPELFAVWMRLLRNVKDSVLWLQSTNTDAVRNLRRAAKDFGVAPERLVFAPRMAETADHLARLSLADLFLDTLPYNAHATACDALWAGLPVLTCLGTTFPGRVAASLLQAVGLPELVTTSLDEYEELARSLAHHPTRLSAIRAQLARNRDIEPLFDTARFTRNLEAAYRMMWDRHEAGMPPASLGDVTP